MDWYWVAASFVLFLGVACVATLAGTLLVERVIYGDWWHLH